MFSDLWNKAYQSICSIQHWQNGQKIASGTGFIVNGYLITNNHVYYCPQSDKVIIEFVEQDGSTISFSKEIDKISFTAALKEGSTETNWDFAILEIDEIKKMPSLKLSSNIKDLSIGMQIGLLGFAFGSNNLSIHSGIISSQFILNNVKYIQIDASVNQGNSGGPLINPTTGEVIGIITRAANGLTHQFNELIKSFDNNIKVLSNNNGVTHTIGGIDPIKVLAISQSQMQRISIEIKRSANVGIGYAFSLDKIREFLDNV